MRCQSRAIDMEDTERSCGFLTTTERAFLLGEWDPNDGDPLKDSQERVKRNDIQVRTRHALADLALLQAHASERLKNGIVQLDEDPPVWDEDVTSDMVNGMLRLAIDATASEEVGDMFMTALAETEADEEVVPLLSAAIEDDEEELATQLVDLLKNTLKDSDLSEGKKKELAVNVQKHLHS